MGRVLVELLELVVEGVGGLVESFPVGYAGEAESRLQILMVRLPLPELYFGVERALASQASAALLLGDDLRAH